MKTLEYLWNLSFKLKLSSITWEAEADLLSGSGGQSLFQDIADPRPTAKKSKVRKSTNWDSPRWIKACDHSSPNWHCPSLSGEAPRGFLVKLATGPRDNIWLILHSKTQTAMMKETERNLDGVGPSEHSWEFHKRSGNSTYHSTCHLEAGLPALTQNRTSEGLTCNMEDGRGVRESPLWTISTCV